MMPVLFVVVCNLKSLSIGTPEIINFPSVPNGKLMVLGIPIFSTIGYKYFSVPSYPIPGRKILKFSKHEPYLECVCVWGGGVVLF